MELSDFGTTFATGFTLSVEERAALEVQMAKKRVEERLHSCVLSAAGPRARAKHPLTPRPAPAACVFGAA